jgi:glycosyltransferase involved in cell wall biosynthesis
MLWHLLTPEYPPDCGGVGDYTALLATALAEAGDVVHVWHPHGSRSESTAAGSTRVAVHALPDRFARASRSLLDRAFEETPGTILVQYVPSAFGARGANVPFCRWLLRTRRGGADVRVMFHEPFFYFTLERPWRNALALTERLMAMLLIRASSTLYFSTETWFRYLAPYGPVAGASVLPVPATIAIDPPGTLIAAWRDHVRDDADFVVGHFGTYGEHVGAELRKVLPAIWHLLPAARVLLVGDGSRAFAQHMRACAPRESGISGLGRLSSMDAAAALRACDVLIAPYPDGVTTRRTSVMAALASGRPVVTTAGALTEPVWRETEAVALAPAADASAFAQAVKRLADDASLRASLGVRGRRTYDDCFDLSCTLRVLRNADLLLSVR